MLTLVPALMALPPAMGGDPPRSPANSIERGSTVLVFLAMGQSNMVGSARPPENEQISNRFDHRVLVRISAGGAQDKRSREALLTDGTPGDAEFSPGPRGGGPDRSFVRSLAANGFRVALVKWARNGSSISYWNKDVPPGHHGSYHDAWMAYFKDSILQLETMGFKVKIGGLLWSQGAGDSNSKGGAVNAPLYEDRLRALIRRFRSEVPGAENAPIIIVRTSGRISASEYAFKDVVRKAQVAVAESEPGAAWVDIDDVPLRDRVHNTAEAYEVIGLRASKAWLEKFSGEYVGDRIAPAESIDFPIRAPSPEAAR